MLVRLSLLVALLAGPGLSTCAQSAPATSDPAAARLTVAQVESTAFFTELGFALDSSLTVGGVRTYRPRTAPMRRRFTLRLRASAAGEIEAVTLGAPVGDIRRNIFLRSSIADFVTAIAPDSAASEAALLIVQVRNNLTGAADTGFYYRSEQDTVLPKRPTAAYLALLGVSESGEERVGSAQMVVTRLSEQSDTAVVLSLVLGGNRVDPGVIADWFDTRRVDLLGATEAELAESDLISGFDLRLTSRTARELRYDLKSTPNVLRVTLDSAARASRLALLLPDGGAGLDASTQAGMLASTLLALVPRKDSVAMAQVLRSVLVGTDGMGAFGATRFNAFVKGSATEVVLSFTASSARITRTGTGSDRMFVLEVGVPGSFATSTAPQPTGARRGTSP